MDALQFREHVVRPTLVHMKMHSRTAEDLMVGTALAESNLTWLTQHGNGPAVGVYQIEPNTFSDIWDRYLNTRPDILARVEKLVAPSPLLEKQLITNLAFATAIARIRYWMDPTPLPDPNDYPNHASYVWVLGETWKRGFNTELGAGTVEKFTAAYPGL